MKLPITSREQFEWSYGYLSGWRFMASADRSAGWVDFKTLP